MITKVKIADKVVLLDCRYSRTGCMSWDFMTDENNVDIVIKTDWEDIKQQKTHYQRLPEAKKLDSELHNSEYEFMLVLRKLADEFLKFDVMLMHGVVVAINDECYMFTAASGTGKTTHAQLWMKNIPGAYIINGDKPFLDIADTVTAYGSPWLGKEGYGGNFNGKLKAICILERAENNSIQPVAFHEILPDLLKQIYLPDNDVNRIKTFSLLGRLSKSVKFYKLQCNMDDSAAVVAYNKLVCEEQE